MLPRTRVLALAFVLLGCSVDTTGLLDPASFDGGPGFDAGPFDGAPTDVGPPFDGGPGFDGGMDASVFDAGVGDSGVEDAGCLESFCEDDTLARCSAGMIERIECDHVCADGAAGIGCYDLAVSNLGQALRDGPAEGPATIGDSNWDTDECESLPGYWQVVEQTGAPEICVLSFDDLEIDGRLNITGERALMIVAAGSFLLTGSIRADAEGQVPGPGGGFGGDEGVPATGPHPGANGGEAPANPGQNWNADGGGGGGGGRFTGGEGGAGGGDESASTGNAAGGGAFSMAYALEPLVGGSGGGVGGVGESRGLGGAGGGALQIVARGGIELQGPIQLSGGAGDGGQDGFSSDNNVGAGGGGGSGGNVLFQTLGDVQTSGDFDLRTSGGGGGGGAGCRGGGDAEDGGEDEDGDVSGGGYDSCGTNFGADGGDGGVEAGGENGQDNRFVGANGGGGGGASGLVVVRALNRPGLGRESDPVLERVD